MAEEQVGAHVKLTGDASGVASAVNQANNAFATLEQAVNTNWWGLQNLGLAFAALPTAVAGGVGVAISYAKQWEDAMFELRRTTGLLGEGDGVQAQFRAIEESIFAVARVTPLATSELAALASEGAALGIANESLAEFARVMGLLVSSTNLTAEGVDNVARVLNIMQVPESEFENFASALVEVGRSTAATETDIITAAKRLATVGSIANVSTPSILGMGAAIRSLGPEAEAGATAVNKTVSDMANAINDGGEKLQAFASISGLTVDQFSNAFRKDAYSAIQQFVTGLGQLPDGAVGIEAAFEAVGISATRTKQALSTLANGTRDVGNEQRDLNAIMANATETYRANTVLQDVEAAKLRTLSGQLQLLKNNFFEAGTALGNSLLTPLSAFTGFLSNLVRGFQVMNPVLRNVLLGTTLMVAGLMGIAAAALLVGPRIVLAVAAMRQLRATQQALSSGAPAFQAAQDANTAAMQRGATAARSQAVALGSLSATTAALDAMIYGDTAATNQNTGAKVKNAQATGFLRGIYGQFSGSIKKATVATLALTTAMIALTYWTQKQGAEALEGEKKRAGAVSDMKQDLNELIFAYQDSADATVESLQKQATALLRQSDSYKRASRSAKELGFSQKNLNNLIKDTGGLDAQQKAFNKLRDEEKAGSKAAGALLDDILDLREGYAAVAQVTKQNTDVTSDFAGALDDAAGNAKDLADSLGKIAQAHLDYIPALFAQREAELALRDAADDLAEARNKQANSSNETAKAENNLRKARRDHEKAVEAVAEAERNLATSRRDGLNDLADAQDDFLDSQDSYYDSVEKIRDLEEELAKLRSGPSVKEITKATNDLTAAQLRLLGANRKVSDAEWYLQYIREQGGSARDIENAEFALAEARQESAEAQEGLSDAEQELADLRDETKRQEAIADLEREIAKARRDSKAALREVSEAERELDEIRRKVANDGYYKDAQDDLRDAQSAVYDSLQDIQDAEKELGKIRGGSLMQDAERAQLNYERALYNVATANTEVKKQTALMRGETFNAGHEAQTLADELARISQNIPNGAARSQMQSFIDILSNAPAVPNTEDYEDAFNTGLSEMDLSPGLEAALEGIDTSRATKDTFGSGSWWQALLAPAALVLGPAISGLMGSVITWVAGALGVSVGVAGGIVAAALAAVVAIAFYVFNDDFRRNVNTWADNAWDWLYEGGSNILGGLLEGMESIGDTINEWIRRKFTEWVIDPFKRLFGINSPSTVFAGFGGDIMNGLLNGIGNFVGYLYTLVTSIGQNIINTFSSAGSWLLGAGGNIVVGLYNGLVGAIGNVWGFIEGVYSGLTGFFGNAGEWLLNAGSNIIRGFYNGLVDGWNTILGWAKSAGGAFLSLFEKLWEIRSPSRVFDHYGEMLMAGLANGLDGSLGAVMSAAEKAAQAADIGEYLKQNDLEYLLSSDGFGKYDPVAGSARIPDGTGGTTNNGDTVIINAQTNATPEQIIGEYLWTKRVRTRG